MKKQRTYTTQQVIAICAAYGTLRDHIGRELASDGASEISLEYLEKVMRAIPLDVYEGIQAQRGRDLGKDDELTSMRRTLERLTREGR